MLKYIGDFDKLKTYGFEITDKGKYTYNELGFEAVYESKNIFNPYIIIVHDREIYFRVTNDESCEYEDITVYVLYDLIKAGLVIKESE